jgi:hypothetical protein
VRTIFLIVPFSLLTGTYPGHKNLFKAAACGCASRFLTGFCENPRTVSTSIKRVSHLAVFKITWQIQKVFVLTGKELTNSI